MGMLISQTDAYTWELHTQMGSHDSIGRGTTGTTGTELLLLLSSPALRTRARRQNSAAGRSTGGGHAVMRPTKLWLCIREFYVEQITIVSYDWFHFDQSHSDSCCWQPGRLRKPSKEKTAQKLLSCGKNPDLIKQSFALLSEVIIFVWLDVDVSESGWRADVIVTTDTNPPKHTGAERTMLGLAKKRTHTTINKWGKKKMFVKICRRAQRIHTSFFLRAS